jgi:uncharacterized protein YggT (Ycf19 family)
MFVKVIGGIIFLIMVVLFLRWVHAKISQPEATVLAPIPQPVAPIIQSVAPIVQPVSTTNTPTGQILSVMRKSGTIAINIGTIAAYYRGIKYQPVTGGVEPRGHWITHNAKDPNKPWDELMDVDPKTMAHTDDNAAARMWIDFGRDIPVDQILIEDRVDCYQDRLVGCVVTLKTHAGQIVWSQYINVVKQSYTWYIATTGVTTLATVDLPTVVTVN